MKCIRSFDQITVKQYFLESQGEQGIKTLIKVVQSSNSWRNRSSDSVFSTAEQSNTA